MSEYPDSIPGRVGELEQVAREHKFRLGSLEASDSQQNSELNRIQKEISGGFEQIRSDLLSMRSKAVGAIWMVGTMITMAALVAKFWPF